jgi:hypothetical protein
MSISLQVSSVIRSLKNGAARTTQYEGHPKKPFVGLSLGCGVNDKGGLRKHRRITAHDHSGLLWTIRKSQRKFESGKNEFSYPLPSPAKSGEESSRCSNHIGAFTATVPSSRRAAEHAAARSGTGARVQTTASGTLLAPVWLTSICSDTALPSCCRSGGRCPEAFSLSPSACR